MRLVVLLVYAVFGYIVWRFVQAVMRMMISPRADRGGRVQGRPGQKDSAQSDFQGKNIKEAEFEDLTPPAQPEWKSPPKE